MRSPKPMASAPPLPPSPMPTTTTGTRTLESSASDSAIAQRLAPLLGLDTRVGARSVEEG